MAKKILVVEDDVFLREMITRKLLLEKFEVVPANDGEEGIEKAKKEKPDLVLLDLILPGIQGYEVLSKIKEDKATAKVPVIILSNLGQKEEVEKGLKMGAVDFLIKANFDPDEIVTKIKSLLK